MATGPYVNHILRGIQEAAETESHGQNLISEIAQIKAESKTRPRNTHIFPRTEHDLYVEPHWVSQRLFEEEKFPGTIWDPCCGTGRIVEAAKAAGLPVFASDIADHGYNSARINFLTEPTPIRPPFSVVTNPAYKLKGEIAHRAFALGAVKVALFLPIAQMNAAWRWLDGLPRGFMYLVTPRPPVPPLVVKKPGGGRPDFVWLILDSRPEGHSGWAWLHRDGGDQ